MKQNFVIICESAVTAEQSKGLYILGTFEELGASEVPAMQPKISVVTNFSGGEGRHDHKILITHEDGEKVAELSGNINFSPQTQNAQYIGTFIGTTFPKYGKYTVDIYIDGNKQLMGTTFKLVK